MIELLKELNVPIIIIIALVLVIPVITIYFKHKLEKQRQKFSSSLAKAQEIQSKKFDVIYELYGDIREFQHCIFHLREDDEVISGYSKDLKEYYKKIRQKVRGNILILGKNIEKIAYDYTDSGLQIETKDFNSDEYDRLDFEFYNSLQKLLKTIPNISEVLNKG